MMLTRIVLSLCIIGMSHSVLAEDIAAGKAASQVCSSCHGVSGISNNDLWPNLAGQKKGYLVKQIIAFREGIRTDPTMVPMAKIIPENQIENVAAYFASLKAQ